MVGISVLKSAARRSMHASLLLLWFGLAAADNLAQPGVVGRRLIGAFCASCA